MAKEKFVASDTEGVLIEQATGESVTVTDLAARLTPDYEWSVSMQPDRTLNITDFFLSVLKLFRTLNPWSGQIDAGRTATLHISIRLT